MLCFTLRTTTAVGFNLSVRRPNISHPPLLSARLHQQSMNNNDTKSAQSPTAAPSGYQAPSLRVQSALNRPHPGLLRHYLRPHAETVSPCPRVTHQQPVCARPCPSCLGRYPRTQTRHGNATAPMQCECTSQLCLWLQNASCLQVMLPTSCLRTS